MKINVYILLLCVLAGLSSCKETQSWSSVGDDVYYSKKDAARERERYLAKVNSPSAIVRKSEEQTISGRNQQGGQASQDSTAISGQQQGTWNNDPNGQIIQGSDDQTFNDPSCYNNSQGWYDPNFGYQRYGTQGYGYSSCGYGSGMGYSPGFGFSIGYGFGNPYGYGLFGSPFSNGYYGPYCGPSYGMGWGSGYGYGYNYGYSPYSNPYWYSPTYYSRDPRPTRTQVPRTNGNTSLPGTVYGNGSPVPVKPIRSVDQVGKTEPVNNGIQAGGAQPIPAQQTNPGSTAPLPRNPQVTQPGHTPYNAQSTTVPDAAPSTNSPHVSGSGNKRPPATFSVPDAQEPPTRARSSGGGFINFIREISEPAQQEASPQPQGGATNNRSYQPSSGSHNGYNSGNNSSGGSQPVYRQPSATPSQHNVSPGPGSGSWGGGRSVSGGGSSNGGGSGGGAVRSGGGFQNRSHR